jgi:hypothetical protein
MNVLPLSVEAGGGVSKGGFPAVSVMPRRSVRQGWEHIRLRHGSNPDLQLRDTSGFVPDPRADS